MVVPGAAVIVTEGVTFGLTVIVTEPVAVGGIAHIASLAIVTLITFPLSGT
jgi:hypothetical protein